MPDDRHGTPRPARYCRACAKQISPGEQGGGRAWELCWRCAEKFFPDQLKEIVEKCNHASGVPAEMEHDEGVCHRSIERCEGCGLRYEGDWVVCDCPDRRDR